MRCCVKVPMERKKEGVHALTEEFGRHREYVTQNIIPRALDDTRVEVPLAHRVDRRAPVIFTEDVDAFMCDQALEWEGDFSWAEKRGIWDNTVGLARPTALGQAATFSQLTVREDDPLRLEAMDALVPRVEDVLILTRPADRPKLAVDEADEIRDRQPFVRERVGKLAKVRRPRGERALVEEMREGVVDVLDLWQAAQRKCVRAWPESTRTRCLTMYHTASEMADMDRPHSHVSERSESVLRYRRSSRSTPSSPVKTCSPSVSNSSGGCNAATTCGSHCSRKPNLMYVVTELSSSSRPRAAASRRSLRRLSLSGPMSCRCRRWSGSADASTQKSATSSSLSSLPTMALAASTSSSLSPSSPAVNGRVGISV